MSIDRRDFLRMCSAAGLAIASPFAAPRAHAAFVPYQGPFYVTIHAGGGWDPTLLCDPKGRVNELELDPVNNYFIDDIAQVGPFNVPPVDGMVEFFTRFRNDLMVINGIDTGTNSHDTGTRHIWSGSIDTGSPAFAALVAGTAPQRPALSFLSNGGYEETAGIVPSTRIPNTNTITSLSNPERLYPSDENSYLFNESTRARIAAARQARYARIRDAATLPRLRKAISTLHEVRGTDNELSLLNDYLPDTLDNSGNQLIRQAQLAMATFRAGLAVSTSMSIGGFDTHGNHDASHIPRMQQIVQGVTAVMDEAEAQGIADQIVLVVGSDFARTPWYNSGNGKDHWSITSMMLMGRGIPGGRLYGATDARQGPRTVDPNTLQLDDNGIRITPGHIHAALRELAGIDRNPAATQFTVGSPLPFFS